VLLDFFTGKRAVIPSGYITLVDVRDVAQAHLLAYENKAAEGR
jgi:nucleoside-diphosphate-sugar epimerase